MLASTLVALLVTIAASGLQVNGGGGGANIEHVVVLMLENRAFDHMCGWLRRDWGIPVNGLTGAEYNVVNGTKYFVNDTCPFVNPFDPYHDIWETTLEFMGGNEWKDPAPMNGFAGLHSIKHPTEFPNVMTGFPPARVPAISTLAKEFAVFDHYFASLPGPTFPNRLFFGSGTTHGFVNDSDLSMYIEGAPQKTLYDSLSENNKTWKQYFGDLPDLLLFKNLRQLSNFDNFKPYKDFQKDAAEGKLPYFSWVSPQFYPNPWDGPARDQHPDHDVSEGDRLIAEVYGALRNSSAWENTMFIVTYDEHGGFFDHVSPPPGPNPDGINGGAGSLDAFNFTRLGSRVCTIVASPYVKKGTVVSQPSDPTKQFEHSSMFATLRDLVGIQEELTNRTAFAASFAFLLESNGGVPRTDCPSSLPTVADKDLPLSRAEHLREELDREPNHLQQNLFNVMEAAVVAKRQKASAGGAEPSLESVKREMSFGRLHKTQHAMGADINRLVKEYFSKE